MTYEYMFFEAGRGWDKKERNKCEKALNELAILGWRLVAVHCEYFILEKLNEPS